MLYKRQRAVTVSHSRTRQVAAMTKNTSPSQSDAIFVVMNALVNFLVDEVLIPHCHLNDDCQESRSRVWSGLFQSADDCHSERSRVSSELYCCQDEDEDEVQVTSCCHDQDDRCHSASFHSSSLFLVFFLKNHLDLVLLSFPILGCP